MMIAFFPPNLSSIHRWLAPLASGLSVFLLTLPVWADPPQNIVNWSGLGLTSGQMTEIDKQEHEWKKTYSDLYPQILRDSRELRQLLNEPHADEDRIRELQSRIEANELRLRHHATQTFLEKKKVLTPGQRQRLKEMMTSSSSGNR
jgi:Spy/CpxP family protein refolding chaperone